MQNLDLKAERLRQTLFDAARELAEFEHLQSFSIPVPNTSPLRFVTYGTKDDSHGSLADTGWEKYGPGVDESTAAKMERDPDQSPH